MGGLPSAGRSVAPSLCPRCGRPLPVTPSLFWPGRGVRVGCSPSPGPSSGRCGEQGWPRKKPAEEEKEEGGWPCRVSCGETWRCPVLLPWRSLLAWSGVSARLLSAPALSQGLPALRSAPACHLKIVLGVCCGVLSLASQV